MSAQPSVTEHSIVIISIVISSSSSSAGKLVRKNPYVSGFSLKKPLKPQMFKVFYLLCFNTYTIHIQYNTYPI